MIRSGHRMSREMLSVRINTHLFDRLKLFVAAKRINVQDFIEETLQEKLDAVDPLHKAADEKRSALASSTSSPDDRISRLEAQIEQLSTALLGPAGKRKRA